MLSELLYFFFGGPFTKKISFTCTLCNISVEAEVYAEEYRHHNKAEKIAREKGWVFPWILQEAPVCPTCAEKHLVKGIVPGRGKMLVTKEMLENGFAFPIPK